MQVTKPVMKTKSFPYDEVLKSSMAYFEGDELAATTWINKYAVKDKHGNFLEKSPADMHKRMAVEFARVEAKYNKRSIAEKSSLSEYGRERKALDEKAIFEYFDKFKYIIPQGSVMAACGNEQMIASLSNCVVIPEVFDSYGGIMHSDQQLVQLFKRRCGVG